MRKASNQIAPLLHTSRHMSRCVLQWHIKAWEVTEWWTFCHSALEHHSDESEDLPLHQQSEPPGEL